MTTSLTHWAGALSSAWGIDATLDALAGEYDLNLRVTATDGRRFILKVMRPGCDEGFVDLLCRAHAHIQSRDPSVPVPAVIPARDGRLHCTVRDADGNERILWLLAMLEGELYARTTYRPLALLRDFGAVVARMHRALADFAHPGLQRDFKWDLTRADWVMHHVDEIADHARQELVATAWLRYDGIKRALLAQPVAVLHNDLNDWNVLVARDERGAPRLAGLIDFGDIVAGPVVADIAIAGAYLVLDHPQPERAFAAFVAGYHAVSPLSARQLDLLWPLLLMRLAVSVTNSAQMKRERPDDPYVVISEAPAWRFLERAATIADEQVSARLRSACGFPASDTAARVLSWLDAQRGSFAPVMGIDLATIPTGSISIATSLAPRDPTAMTETEARTLGAEAGVGPAWVGSYGEPRAVYTAPAFRKGPHAISDRRSVHIGVDIFLPAGSPVYAPLDAVVETVEFREATLDYGGMVILRHATPDGAPFWTLYGHLSRSSAEALHAGQPIARGDRFAELGVPEENGGWDPHLHFQLAMTTRGMAGDWPGVADPDDLAMWCAICPNPAALLNLPNERVAYRPLDEEHIRHERGAHFASNLKLSYREPLLFVRGWKHYLFDEWGRVHLDAYNNVPHVGHAHPRLVAIAADQLARMNSNTRYLHPAQVEFAETLLAHMPPHLTHVFFVNSGSEGNELALRLARTHTGGKDMVTPDHGYHGNTTGAYDLSAYKFNKPNGGGCPEWVQLVPVADTYRGEHRGADAADGYAAHVDEAIARIHARGGRLAGFIAETFPSVGGQIIPPVGYLQGVYDRIRAAGGVCIADEVQTGLGRLGDYFWGFEQQQVAPDIVVLGKPLGNGHPMGAVVTTAEIARSFDNGIEFFSTFGGSTLSCRVGTEVLRIVKDEGLRENARTVGNHLLDSLRELQTRHACIGDVRGIGLFVGVDLVTDRDTRAPATALASYVVNRLREERILIGTEGPADNVLKIRPPLTVGRSDVEWLVAVLGRVIGELSG
ncbi:MAG: aminotransferase class III-fold pyridoxal phosphate-dependent enzyme [Gemmatimonadetes bacterium]|nr:aminotransferase class III-fold pyridoxal phosphate-dependent enzyme [Gemmatimonadota bacterium]